MSTNFGDIAKKLGLHDGFPVPIANDENKLLQEELAILSLRKSKAKNVLEIINGKLDSLKDHFKFVGQESEQTQVGKIFINNF